MRASPVSSILGDIIEKSLTAATRSAADGFSFQQVAQEAVNSGPVEANSAALIAGDGAASAPPVQVGEGKAESPERGINPYFTGDYRLSSDPIWDTGWEIEPHDPELGRSAIAALEGLFERNGVAKDQVKLSYIEELAVCPGVRSWVNHSVVVEYPDGQLEKFSAECTLKGPQWTLCSMLQRMGAEGPVLVDY
jgi:hypothetical protein